MRWTAFLFATLLVAQGLSASSDDNEEFYDESVPEDGDSEFVGKLQQETIKARSTLSNSLKQDVINLLYDAAREGNGTVACMEISPDDIHLPQNAGDTAQLYGIPEQVHDYLRSLNIVPFVRRSAAVVKPRDKYDYTYKLMASWMPPNGPEAKDIATGKNAEEEASKRRKRSKASATLVQSTSNVQDASNSALTPKQL